jgi:hypothetical protein
MAGGKSGSNSRAIKAHSLFESGAANLFCETAKRFSGSAKEQRVSQREQSSWLLSLQHLQSDRD